MNLSGFQWLPVLVLMFGVASPALAQSSDPIDDSQRLEWWLSRPSLIAPELSIAATSFEDKNYVGDNTGQGLRAAIARTLDGEIYKRLLEFFIQNRVTRSSGPSYAGGLVYSSFARKFDIGYSRMSVAGHDGNGFSLQFDPMPAARWGRQELNELINAIGVQKGLIGPLPREQLINRLLGNPIVRSQHAQSVRQTAESSRAFRTLILLDYRDIDRLGSFTTAGISASKLLYAGEETSNAVLIRAQVSGAWFNPDFGNSHSTVRSAFLLAWQNGAGFRRETIGSREDLSSRLWSLRAGIEYRPRNALAPEHAVSAFVRHVDHKRHLDTTFSVGKDGAGQEYVGFRIGYNLPIR